MVLDQDIRELENKGYIVIDFKPIPEYRKALGMRLLKRLDPWVLYATNCYSFEVHKIRIQEHVRNPFTREFIKVMEKLASSEDFGRYAWCFERLSTTIRYFGLFGECVDEILSSLDHWGFVCVDEKDVGVLGYLF